MSTETKRIAYLAPELPSLSATFVTNEIWALEEMGVEIIPFSVHTPGAKAHGERAAELAGRTRILYNQPLTSAYGALCWNALHHKRSTLRALGQLSGDLFKLGLITPAAIKLGYQFLRGAWLARELRRTNVEHLHIHFAHVPTQIGMYAASLAGIPFSFMAHANDIFERPLLIKEKIRRSKRTVTISEFNVDLMHSQGGDPAQMRIVRCAVDSRQKAPWANQDRQGEPFVIGTLGRLVEKKGVDTLIAAGQHLRDKQLDFRIEIAGDGPLREQLETQVQTAGLREQVIFKGSMPHSEALTWMASLNAFVLAGKKDRNGDMDGIPVVLMEAMNAGIPVLSTKLSGIPELVIHQRTGLLSDPGNAEELAANLKLLLEDPDLARTLSMEAKKWIGTEFDRRLNARRLLDLIHETD